MSKEKKVSEPVTETALAETGSTAVSTLATDLSAWGDSQASSKDIIISKVLVMQGLSEFVTEGIAKFGDFVDSSTKEVLGSISSPIEFVPFHMEKVWIISSRAVGTEKFEFEKYEAVTPANETAYPFSEVIGTTEFKYEYCLQFYVLMPNDPIMPKVIAFKATSLRTGKALATQMYFRNKAAGLIPPAYTMELSGKKDKNEKGTFAVLEVKPKGKTDDFLLSECLNWLNIVKLGKAKVAGESAVATENYATDENAKF